MIDDKIMHERRLDRLRHVECFLKTHNLRPLALMATHNLLTGFFQNSHWRVAWFCFTKAISNSWGNFTTNAWFFWNTKILRLNQYEIERKIDKESGVRIETCSGCGWSGYETELKLVENDEWSDAFCPKCGQSTFAELFVPETQQSGAITQGEK
jgi:hypothetical protein